MPSDHPTTETLTRADLELCVYELGYTRRESDALLGTVLDEISGALSRGEDVRLRGFGAFKVRRHAGHGRDLRTGKPLETPSGTSVVFRPSKGLRQALTEALGEGT